MRLKKIARLRVPPLSTKVCAFAAVLVLLVTSSPADAQSVLERTPNMSGAWVGPPSTLHLNVLHRVATGDEPLREDDQTSTFLLGWGVGGYSLLGVQYAAGSNLVEDESDEWEAFARLSPLSTEYGASFDFGLTAAYNETAESLDGEFTLSIPFGPVKSMALLRRFSNAYGEDDTRWVFGTGARIRLTDRVAIAGDFVKPTTLRDDEQYAWGTAVQMSIPHTPLTLSLHASNTSSSTLQGSSKRAGKTRYGFEVTIPLAPSRYFGGDRSDPGARLGETDFVAGDTVEISIGDIAFDRERVVVLPGTYVVWKNESTGIHSSTAEDGTWNSPLLGPGDAFGRIFNDVGEFTYFSSPRPDMRAVVVVQGGFREEE